MREATVPCDRCGQVSQTLSLAGTERTYDGPFSDQTRVQIASDVLSAVRNAIAAHDMLALRKLNPQWSDDYCAQRDASYCKKHLEWGQVGPEHVSVTPCARCPEGHFWDI